MNIKVWSNFSKRRNSTKQPTGGTIISCVLKETTSIEKPTFVFASNDFSVNYVEAFGHYYFVDDIKSVRNNIIEVSCSQDVLATYKSSITGSSQYVERANTILNVHVPDPLNPPTDHVEATHNTIMIFTDDIIDYNASLHMMNDHYIMAVTGKTGTEFWHLTSLELRRFFDAVFSQNFLQQFTSQFYDYRDCVISLKRVTYNPIGDPGQQIYLGEHGVTDGNGAVTATALNDNPIIRDSGLVQLSYPADAHLNVRSYPYYAPYTMGSIYLPLVGNVPLDVSAIGGSGKIGVKLHVDKYTADLVYTIYNENDKILGTYSGSAGMSLPIAAQHYNPSTVVGGVIQTVGGVAAAVAGGSVAGLGVASIGSGLGSIAEGVKLHTQVNGNISSFIGGYISQAVTCDIYTNTPVSWTLDNMKTSSGVIVMEQKSLSGLSGYVQCRNASVDIPGFEEDKEAIQGFMNSGFYIE